MIKSHLAGVSLAAIAALCLNTGVAAAHPAEMGFDGPRGQRLAERLELSEAQQSEIETILSEGSESREALRDALRAVREQLREAGSFEQYDPALVEQLAREQADLMTERLTAGIALRNAVQGVLTEDQRAELAELRQRRAGRRGPGRFGAGGRFGGEG